MKRLGVVSLIVQIAVGEAVRHFARDGAVLFVPDYRRSRGPYFSEALLSRSDPLFP